MGWVMMSERELKRCRSTIFRELKRNHFSDQSMPKCDGYYGAAAHLMAADRLRLTSLHCWLMLSLGRSRWIIDRFFAGLTF